MRGDFCLGDWIVSPRRECVRRGGGSVHVHPKPMAVLQRLADAGGEVVTREELFEAVWPGVIVTDDALTQCIVELRKAFGDSARQQAVIRTVPKVGFCLVPPVRRAGDDVPVIAVLPFVNMSPDPEQEYFSDGISEELINLLAKTPGLRVISHTSAFSFKRRPTPIPEIARRLGVTHVLEGSVRQSGDRVRITAQLVETRSDTHLWSRNYDRDLSGIFSIQDDIAQRVVGKVRATLLRNVPKSAPVDPEAYRLFLLGRFHLNAYDFPAALENFRRSIAIEPNFAQAHVAIAAYYGGRTFFGELPPREGYARISEALERALDCAGGSAGVDRPLAEKYFYHDWDWAKAEAAFERALERVPSDAHCYQLYAWFLTAMRRWDEARDRVERALALEPLSPAVYLTASNIEYFAGRHRRAIEHCHRALELSPEHPLALSQMGWSLLRMDAFEAALEALERSVGLAPGNSYFRWLLGYGYAVAGRTNRAREVIGELHIRGERQYVMPFGFAVIHAGLGEHGTALDWLERAFAERNGWMVYLDVAPSLDPLRGEPRFRRLLARMRFPAGGAAQSAGNSTSKGSGSSRTPKAS
jgi:serine/threonine-protein kinase